MGRTVLNMSEEELLNMEMIGFHELIKVHKRVNGNEDGEPKAKPKEKGAYIDSVSF